MSLSSSIEISSLSFDQALKESENIVKSLESGSLDLESAVTHYVRATELLKHCSAKLQEAQLKVQRIIEQDGKAVGIEEMPDA